MDDTWLKEEVFVNHMEDLLGDKLYGHDHKKTVQRVDMGKEPEEKLAELHQFMREFYAKVAEANKNIFGYVSLNNFNKFLSQI